MTTPAAAGSLYGGDKKGSFEFSVQNNNIYGTAEMNEQPTDGKVYEGWFEDKGDASGYSLSVGKFDNDNTLTINQTMVNPYTYTVFFVTTEPVDDSDPNPSDVVVGTKLPIPFGNNFFNFLYNITNLSSKKINLKYYLFFYRTLDSYFCTDIGITPSFANY